MTVTEILDSFCFILNAHRRIEKDTLRAKKATVSESESSLSTSWRWQGHTNTLSSVSIREALFLRLKELPEVRWRPEEVRVDPISVG